MVIYCLCIAFQDTTCEILWEGYKQKADKGYKSKKVVEKGKNHNWVSVIEDKVTTDKAFDQYMDPIRDFSL